MPISIFKIFIIFGIVSRWAEKALADGKITLMEVVDLAVNIAPILGVSAELDLDAFIPPDDLPISQDAEIEASGFEGPPPKIVPQE